jgi:putative salt-induced outer membrane protein
MFYLLLPLQAFAADDAAPPGGAWKGEGELGFTSISGNSDAENLIARLGAVYEARAWKHAATLEAVRAETDGELSADYARLREKSEYSLGEHSYTYGQLRYEDDEFSGYDYRVSLSFGLGNRFIDREDRRLDLAAGVGARRSEESDSGDTVDEGILSGDLVYEQKIGDTARFSERMLVEAGEDNTYFESETALSTKINDSLAAKVSYLVKRNSSVPPGNDRTDRITTVSLVYAF